MLLLFKTYGNTTVPMTVVNVHTGEELMEVHYFAGRQQDIEFVEQFNENILLKMNGKPLKVHDTVNKKVIYMPEFLESPDAFVFIYEREIFVSLKDGRIVIWSIDGSMINE